MTDQSTELSGVLTGIALCSLSLRESLVSLFLSDQVWLIVASFTSAGKIHLISPLPVLSDALAARTSAYALAGFSSASTDDAGVAKKHEQPAEVRWIKPKGDAEREEGRLVEIEVPGTLKQVTWHKRGDYFATVASEGELMVWLRLLVSY